MIETFSRPYLNYARDTKPTAYGEIYMFNVPFIQTFKAMRHSNKDNNMSGFNILLIYLFIY